MRFDTITFLSDYGYVDEFVGVCKSVIRSLAPDVFVVDLTHEIPPYDVRAGGLALARSAQYLCPGVVLAVVDPGVATTRRPVVIEVGDGQSYLVGPDNGLLAPAVALSGGATGAVVLDRPEYQLESAGPTFAGRDVFAPACAHLCLGVPMGELGTPVDVETLVPGLVPLPREEGETVVGEVLWVDRYGNCQLNVDPDDVAGLGDRLRLSWGGTRPGVRTARRAVAFDDLSAGEVGLLVDSYGLLAVVSARGSASQDLGLHAGSEVVLGPLSEDDEPSRPSPVTLRRKEEG